MSLNTLSSRGISLLTISQLNNQQLTLTTLNQQLGSAQKFNDLTDYTPVEAQNLMNFQNGINQRQSYIDSMKAVSTRLNVYDATMNDLENITSQAHQLAALNPNLDTTKIGILQQQVLAFMNQAVTDLNQQIGNRYIYAGTRYSTMPVDLNSVLTNLTPSATPVTSNTLPDYDTQAPGTSTPAWTQDTVTIDANDTLTYGVTSTQTGFQNLIAGMQFINAATQTGVSSATYQSDMSQAATLLTTALSNIQTYHAGVASAQNSISQETDAQNTFISSLQSQIGDIKNVNLAEVGINLNLLQTQLQASYSATATLTQNSILKYL